MFAQEVMSRIELKPSMLPACDLHVPFQVTGLCDALCAMRMFQGPVVCYYYWHCRGKALDPANLPMAGYKGVNKCSLITNNCVLAFASLPLKAYSGAHLKPLNEHRLINEQHILESSKMYPEGWFCPAFTTLEMYL